MKKRLSGLLLVCALAVGLFPGLPARAATQSSYAPYAMIDYGYSSTVTCGTVRYISQVSSDGYFYSSYWPSGNVGYYVGAQVECGTASMSMALSYIGVNATPKTILEANNGATVFTYGWGGSTYQSVGASSLTTAMSNYINGGGRYSPPVIHIPGYSAAGHYVVVVGQISSGKYQILDPWQRTVTTMTVSGASATYSHYGATTYDTIDQIHQWYKADASINNDVTITFHANGGSCATATKDVQKGAAVGALPTPTRSGYTFAGWYSSTDGGTDPITSTTIIDDAVTYYAHWTSNRSNGNRITFDATGGILPGAMATYVLSGTNTYRDTNNLILFNCDGQKINTNPFGTEIAVDSTGKVIGKRPYLSTETLTVPSGGFVLSGHGDNVGMCTYIDAVHLGYYVSVNSNTVSIYDNRNAYLASQKTMNDSDVYGELPVPDLGTTPFLGWFTDPYDGARITADSPYTTSYLYAHWGCDHRYTTTNLPAACGTYPTVRYDCTLCGTSFTSYADENCTPWSETRPSGTMVEEKTQYAYSDYETITSLLADQSGYMLLGSEWKYDRSASVRYVDTWPTGFDTSHSLYTQYNKKSEKYSTTENATTKTQVRSDKTVGYLYYHWCDTSKTSCMGYQTGVYNTFHAYFDTANPNQYECDASDYSYKTSHATCSSSKWWLVVEVKEQSVDAYYKLFIYGRWGDWSFWSDSPMAGGATRQVQSRTMYRTVTGSSVEHSYVNGSCVNCGITCAHSWSDGCCLICGTVCNHSYSGGLCTVCGQEDPIQDWYLFGYINGAPYGYENDYANLGQYRIQNGTLVTMFESASYVGVKTADNLTWYMTSGYLGTSVTSAVLYPSTKIANGDLLYVPGGVEVTFTLTENADGTVMLSYKAEEPPVALKPKSPALSFEDEVFINVFFTAENLGNLGMEDMGLITWTTARSEGTVENAEYNIPGATYDSVAGRYIVRSQGIRPQQLSDTLYFKVYIRLSDGSYLYTKLLNYSPKTYATNMLNANTSSAKLKSLMVAMLNYGAAAQTYFSYKPYNLMNSSLSDSQRAMVSGYSASMVNSLPKADALKTGIFANSGGYSSKKPAVSFEGAFSINYFFTPSNPAASMKLYYWVQKDYEAVTTLSPNNATGSIKMTNENGVYTAVIDQIPAKELNSGIYVAAGYSYNSVSYCTGVLPYSIGAYCASMATKEGNVAGLARATAVYGYYAKQYFG